MADDAGALLVRSGLVSNDALEVARARVAEAGGTLGEQLVASGSIADDALTDFYKSRLLVPQVNPNTLARLPAKVVAVIPTDMAIELRAIPVSLDKDNNLTVAMSDPSDRHAVDEIAFFTSAYVVRAVATQMQIAWCLAHYYGHVTQLGQRLLQPGQQPPSRAMAAAVRAGPRPRGDTGRQPKSETIPQASEPIARSVSGEIRIPRRAPSIRPPLEPDFESESGPVRLPEPGGPIISIEAGEPSGPNAGAIVEEIVAGDETVPSGPVIQLELDEPDDEPRPSDDPTERSKAAPPRRRRPAEPDPPELAARAGEIGLKSGPIRVPEMEEARVVIADELEEPRIAVSRSKTEPLDNYVPPDLRSVSGEVEVQPEPDRPVASQITVEIADDPGVPVLIHERAGSEPVLLERRREPEEAPTLVGAPPALIVEDEDVEEEVLELPPKRAPRRDRRTQLGVGVVAALTKAQLVDNDPTRLDSPTAPLPVDYTISDDHLAAPPSPVGDDDTSPVAVPPTLHAQIPPPSGKVVLDNVRARSPEGDLDDDSAVLGKVTNVMSAVDLDELMPERTGSEGGRRVDYDPIDDGWGPPGTTIPPPLLGAIPGAVEAQSGIIPIPNMDSAPLMVAPPVAPEVSRPDVSPQTLARAFEESMTGMLDLIRELEHATERDEVVALMITHLCLSHRRAGFFATRSGELSLFAVNPRPSSIPVATLRLDRPSTLQDVVGTRLPYRGPMHDDASRTFLASVLGAAPPEILLVPVVVRERVVGVLFGEHRMRHTFDDQLALAARAAGFALERILKARRS